jgi:hypothetical protein
MQQGIKRAGADATAVTRLSSSSNQISLGEQRRHPQGGGVKPFHIERSLTPINAPHCTRRSPAGIYPRIDRSSMPYG